MLVGNQPNNENGTLPMAECPTPDALERGDLGLLPHGLPIEFSDADFDFLRSQTLAPNTIHDITYDVATQRCVGAHPPEHEARLQRLLGQFSEATTVWLRETFPHYADAIPDRVTFRTEEEATRPGPVTSRIDLLHLDSFPSRPTLGHRILRVCWNINPHDERVWATAGRFTEILGRFALKHKVPMRSRDEWIAPPQALIRLFTGEWSGRPSYDAFMLRLHHFLKEDDEYQSRATRKLWHFAPSSAWLLFTDGVAYAQLRGRYALEQSFLVPPSNLVLPEEAPVALLEKFGIESRLRRVG